MSLLGLSFQLVSAVSVCFASIVFIYKHYKVRSRYDIIVNCWFCNENSTVPLQNKNSWVCTNSVCQQYNGFNNDGDYNIEIVEQFDYYRNMYSPFKLTDNFKRQTGFSNGLCFECNKKQYLKIVKICRFEAKKENTYEAEFNKYKLHLEKLYKLCPTCEKHLKQVLQDKKKMVLGLKLSDFLFNKVGYLNRFSKFVNTTGINYPKWNFSILNILILFMSLFNFLFVLNNIYKIVGLYTEQDNSNIKPVIYDIFNWNIIYAGFTGISEMLKSMKSISLLRKTFLLIKSIFFFGTHYIGLKFPKYVLTNEQIIHLISLLLSIFRNFVDGFQPTRYTVVLATWSVYFIIQNAQYFDSIVYIKVVTSIVVLIFSIPSLNKRSVMVASNSFHKIYFKDSSHHHKGPFEFTSLHKNQIESPKNKSKFFSGKINKKFQDYKSSPTLTTVKNIDIRTLEDPFKTIKLDKDMLLPFEFLHRSRNSVMSDIRQYDRQFQSCQQNNVSNSRREDKVIKYKSFGVCNNQPDCVIRHPHQLPSDEIWSSNQNNYKNKEGNCTLCPFSNLATTQNVKPSILSPSKFCHKTRDFETGTQSWLSGGYFNSNHCGDVNSLGRNFILSMVTKSNLSRASSQSSGFESNTSSIRNKHLNYCMTENNVANASLLRNRIDCQQLDIYSSHDPQIEVSKVNTIGEPFVSAQSSVHKLNTPFTCKNLSFLDNCHLNHFGKLHLQQFGEKN